MKLDCGYYGWTGGVTSPSIPNTDIEPVRAPAQPGAQGERLQVAIGRFPGRGEPRGVLYEATIENLSIRDRSIGPNTITISAPATPYTMSLIGDPIDGATDQFGRPLYDVRGAVAYELLVGSDVDGKVRWRFVVRDQVEVSNGRVHMTATGFVGGLTGDRVIGGVERQNLLRNNSSFEHGDFRAWTLVSIDGDGEHRTTGGGGVTSLSAGTATAGIVAGGPDGGGYAAWVQGTPGQAWLEGKHRYTQPPHPWGRQRIAATSYVKLPSGLDIDDYGLVTVAIRQSGAYVWPSVREGDPEAGIVTSDMGRGSWITEPVIGIGKLPDAHDGFVCDILARLHAVSETHKTFFDGCEIVRRENTSTDGETDLVNHPLALFRHAQSPSSPGFKSTWGLGTVEGDPVGIVEQGVWWHPDGQTLDEALEALCGRGMEMWDMPGPGRKVKVSKRRGTVRGDLIVQSWDVLAEINWRVDPRAQKTAIRAVSAAGSIWGGADEGAVDTSQANGQVIDVVMSGPVGMTPRQLVAWVRDQLAGVSRIPASMTVLLPWDLGWKLAVGDTVPVGIQSLSAGHKDWMRVTEWVPEQGRRFIAVSLGTDPALGGF